MLFRRFTKQTRLVGLNEVLRGEIGLEGGFFNNFYEFFSKNRNGYNLFILYEHLVYIFKKIL